MTDPNRSAQQITAHALQLGDRINTAGFEGRILSTTPLAVQVGESGMAVVFRYGVTVLIGLSAQEETEVLDKLKPRTFGAITPQE